MVVWDDDLLPPDTSVPMDYTAEKPQEVRNNTMHADTHAAVTVAYISLW